MNIIEHLPHFLQEVREYKEICKVEDIELENIQAKMNELLDEVIVNRASMYGLARYEKIYNIKNISDNIDIRRFNILSKINNRAPFTLKWLDNKLKQLVGENNYKINIENYRITISIVYLFGDVANTLQKDLRELLPANLIIKINLFSNFNLYLASIVHEKERIKLEVVR